MLNNLELTIGTGRDHVLRTGGPRPEYLAHVHRPTFLARARAHIYGVSEIGHGKIFRITGEPIGPTARGGVSIGRLGGGPIVDGLCGPPIPSGGSHPCHISVHPAGEWIYVSNYGDGVVRAVHLGADGDFGPCVDLTHSGSGPVRERQGGPHAHFSAVVDDHLVIADLGTDHLRVHELTGGRPAPQGEAVAMPPGSGPRHFTQVGERLIIAGELDGSLTEVDTTTWQVGRSVPAAKSAGQHHLSHITHAHGSVIVAVRGSNTLSVLDEDLTLRQEVPTAAWPRHFAIADTAGGPAVVVAGERSEEIALHPLDPDPVHLHPAAETLAAPTPMFVGVGEEF